MINKSQLKKIINEYGKESMLRWMVEDGNHYLTNGYMILRGNDKVFDTEIIGLLYKYFGRVPKAGEGVYVNEKYKDPKTDEWRYRSHIHKDMTIERFEGNLEITDDMMAFEFSGAFVHWANGEAAVYEHIDSRKLFVIDRKYYDLIDKYHHPFAFRLMNYGFGCKFHDAVTGSQLTVMPLCKGSIPYIIGPEGFEYIDKTKPGDNK
jgi:hypothetical protein